MTRHPSDTDLALLSGEDLGFLARLRISRHVNGCLECAAALAEFRSVRDEAAMLPEPQLNWASLEAEMRANIRLGLEAGECIRAVPAARTWNPRLAAALGCLAMVVGAGVLMHRPGVAPNAAAVLETSDQGLEVRSKSGSLMLLNRHGAVADQTVNAQGAIRARYVDGEAGTVTINNVYLE